MKLNLLLVLVFVSTILFGQSFQKVTTSTEEYYIYPYLDSIRLDMDYPDGRWKMFEGNDSNSSLLYVFHLENNRVQGSFLKLKNSYFQYGNYYQDSLWTFLTNEKDTTFKVGKWLEYLPFLDHWPTDVYKIPYNDDGTFTEEFIYPNGRLRSRRIYQKGIGLKNEQKWDYYTGKLKFYSHHTPNSSIGFRYSNDSLVYVGFWQDDISVQNSFNNYMFIPGILNIDVCHSKSELEIPNSIFDATVNEDNQLKNASFRRNQSRVEFEDGFMIVEYRNRRGKWKTKRIRIEKLEPVD